MIEAVLRSVRHVGSQLAAALPRAGGGGCGIHFDAGGVHFVRLARVAGLARLRLAGYGSAVLEDDMLRGALIAKPEAAARRLDELLERIGLNAQDLRDDTIVLALPAHGLKTQVVDYPADLPPRALLAWCERRAALLLPGNGAPDLRNRVGVTWADPGNHRLRLYACEADLVDDRVAVLEMSGLRVHAIDAAHEAGRRAFRWAWPNDGDLQVPERAGTPMALLQVDAHDLDLSVFDSDTCVADARERFDGVGGHPEALASVVRELAGKLPVGPSVIYVAAQGASPGGLVAICDAVSGACGMPVRPFDPLRRFETPGLAGPRRQTFAQRTSLAVPCGLALRAMSMQGVACE
ncbi:MAG: pilus assembly protein PilM [Pandoraea sp.]|nr:pilus assembly protein PilM [Pandoraea sp.]MDR3399241.1 pilus assembly protein PilM [Pandoraea sp.]